MRDSSLVFMAGKTERKHRCGIIVRMRRAVPQHTRIYAPDALAPGAQLALSGPAAHHLSRVLRATVGDHLVVFNEGVEFPAGLSIRALENTDKVFHLVIPAKPTDLSDEDLDKVVGGAAKKAVKKLY